jgi:putative ABC transport system substrate-binding protein
VPRLKHVGILENQDNPSSHLEIEQMRRSAPELGLELTVLPGQPAEIEASLAKLSTGSGDGLVITDDAVIETFMTRLVALAAEKHLPAIYGFSTAPKLGGLMSYSADFFAMWRRNAGYVDRILKGAHPADLPIEQATEVALNINLTTAKALGLTVPQALLVTANELIE